MSGCGVQLPPYHLPVAINNHSQSLDHGEDSELDRADLAEGAALAAFPEGPLVVVLDNVGYHKGRLAKD